MSYEQNNRKLQGTNVSAVLATIEQEFAEVVPRALENEPAKIVALRAGARTPRAAENWKGGFNLPTVPHFIMLAREYPQLKAAVERWLNLESNSDPEAARLLNEVVLYLQRKR